MKVVRFMESNQLQNVIFWGVNYPFNIDCNVFIVNVLNYSLKPLNKGYVCPP